MTISSSIIIAFCPKRSKVFKIFVRDEYDPSDPSPHFPNRWVMRAAAEEAAHVSAAAFELWGIGGTLLLAALG